jgi:hypothetical protein
VALLNCLFQHSNHGRLNWRKFDAKYFLRFLGGHLVVVVQNVKNSLTVLDEERKKPNHGNRRGPFRRSIAFLGKCFVEDVD